MRFRQTKHFTRALTITVGGLLAMAMGLACLRFSFAEPLARLSYNLPFILRSNLDTDKVILVYLDEESAKQLHQPIDDVWNRALHVPLLDRLTQENARLVFYDIVFDQPAPDPAADVAFADSIRRNGKVILGATLDKIERMGGVSRKSVAAPTKPLRKAAAGWNQPDSKRDVESSAGTRRKHYSRVSRNRRYLLGQLLRSARYFPVH